MYSTSNSTNETMHFTLACYETFNPVDINCPFYQFTIEQKADVHMSECLRLEVQVLQSIPGFLGYNINN